jgi:hypothetical protein
LHFEAETSEAGEKVESSKVEPNGEEQATKLLKSLVADIEAMHAPLDYRPFECEDYGMDERAFFGEFTDYFDSSITSVITTTAGEGVKVYWPNLLILMEDAKKVLEQEAER